MLGNARSSAGIVHQLKPSDLQIRHVAQGRKCIGYFDMHKIKGITFSEARRCDLYFFVAYIVHLGDANIHLHSYQPLYWQIWGLPFQPISRELPLYGGRTGRNFEVVHGITISCLIYGIACSCDIGE